MSSTRLSKLWLPALCLLLLCIIGQHRQRCEATRYAAGDDTVLDAKRRLYLAYIIQEDDIMVKKACICMPRRHCRHTDNVQLTEDKCSNPNICCVTTDTGGIDFDKY